MIEPMLEIPFVQRVTMTDLIHKINELVDWCNTHDEEHDAKVRESIKQSMVRMPQQLVNLSDRGGA